MTRITHVDQHGKTVVEVDESDDIPKIIRTSQELERRIQSSIDRLLNIRRIRRQRQAEEGK